MSENAEPSRSATSLVELAIVGSIAAGMLQLAVHLLGRFILGHAWSFNPRMVWLAPLANLTIFLPAVAITALVASVTLRNRQQRADRILSIEIWVATAIVSLAPLLLLRPKLHLVAVIVLAVGTGAIASRWS
ncbi:MAG: hypothetical protein ABIT38_04390, partial [Gemmatimonadaceae bacterium]